MISVMLDAPKQNWKLYEELCEAEHVRWLRSLTPEQSWRLYRSMFQFASRLESISGVSTELELDRWEEKLAIRKRLCDLFAKRDKVRRD